MYSQNDYRTYLEHSWGKKPEQKAAEKAYNQKYYQEHKEKWKKYKENISDTLGFDDKKQFEDADAEFKELDNQLRDLRRQINSYSGELTPKQKEELQKLYDKYYEVLDQVNAASEKRSKARENYEKNGSLAKVIDDGAAKTAKRAYDAVDEKVSDIAYDVENKVDEISGNKAKRQVEKTSKEYKRLQEWADITADDKSDHGKKWHEYDVERANEAKAAYEKALDDYGNTPIGRVKNTIDVLTGKKKVRY